MLPVRFLNKTDFVQLLCMALTGTMYSRQWYMIRHSGGKGEEGLLWMHHGVSRTVVTVVGPLVCDMKLSSG